MEIAVRRCSSSLSGSCSIKLCYSSTDLSVCSTFYTAFASFNCDSSFWVQESCGSCTNTPSCTNCLKVSSSYDPAQSEVCYPAKCQSFSSLNTTFDRCNSGVDWTGSRCNCCFHISATSGEFPGICTNTNPALSSVGFTSYAKDKTSNSHEIIKKFCLALLLVVVLSLFTS